MVGKLKGANGSITSFDIHKNENYLSSVSLDRYMRVYNLTDNN